ncbi:MAG: ABC transporter ATP-binding protein [Alphaproteobacteria bacterium]|nr:ABC transporter ATP-binding protein [Alphaproteobacteria bacterium]MCK6458201.1 ABC transporter ATP-binding protein [Phycisphaerae bacterium]
MSDAIFSAREVTIRFGGLVALDRVDIDVAAGEILAVIGPNGAGKSTLFNVITGIYAPSGGRVRFDGEDITGWQTHDIVMRGISRTFQASRLFSDLSVLDNVVIGLHTRTTTNVFEALCLPSRSRRELTWAAATATEILKRVGGDLYDRRYRRASELAQADRRRLEIARALAAKPKLLLLDEPTAGMDDRDTDALIEDIRRIKADRPEFAIIVVEHDMRLVASLPSRVVVLDYGRKIADAPFDVVRRDPRVQEAYLGQTEP